jgi:ribose/xylose/arabinose/galactoside ABC-type transport system permease subunit
MSNHALRLTGLLDPSRTAVIVLLALVTGTGFAVSERFGSVANFTNVLEQAAALGFVSLGQTLVVLAGGIDLSIGALVSALTVLIATLCDRYPEAAPLIILLAVATGALVGAANAAVSLLLRIHPLIVTIGTAAILNGITLMVTRQPAGSVPVWLEEFAFGRLLGIPLAGIAMLLLYALAGLWLARMPQGRRIYAIGGNREAARLTGIPVRGMTVLVYALSGMTAALAAIYFAARTGTGDPLGTLLGVLLISLLNNLLNYMNISTFLQWVVQGLIIIAAVSFQAKRRQVP